MISKKIFRAVLLGVVGCSLVTVTSLVSVGTVRAEDSDSSSDGGASDDIKAIQEAKKEIDKRKKDLDNEKRDVQEKLRGLQEATVGDLDVGTYPWAAKKGCNNCLPGRGQCSSELFLGLFQPEIDARKKVLGIPVSLVVPPSSSIVQADSLSPELKLVQSLGAASPKWGPAVAAGNKKGEKDAVDTAPPAPVVPEAPVAPVKPAPVAEAPICPRGPASAACPKGSVDVTLANPCVAIRDRAESTGTDVGTGCAKTMLDCPDIRLSVEIAIYERRLKAIDKEYKDIKDDLADNRRDMIDAYKVCPQCRLAAAMRPREPSGGEKAAMIISALMPGVTSGLGLWGYSMGLDKYSENYGKYADTCVAFGVPCAAPGMGGMGMAGMGGGMGGMGGGMGMGGMGMPGMGGGIGLNLGLGMGGMGGMGMGMPGMGGGYGMGMPGMGGGYGMGGMGGGMGLGLGLGMGGGMGMPGMGMGGYGMGNGMGGMGGGFGPPGGMWTGGYGMPTNPYGTGFNPMMFPTGAMGNGMGGMGMGGMGMGGMGMGNSQYQMMLQASMQQQQMQMQAAQTSGQNMMIAQQQMVEAQMRYQQSMMGMGGSKTF